MTKEKQSIEDKIKEVLGKIRPSLQADGGDVEFKAWNAKTGEVQVQLRGMCVGCPMSQMTLKQGIEAGMREEIPEVKTVISV